MDDREHSVYERRLHIIGESKKGRLILVSFAESRNEIRIISAQRPTPGKERIMKKAIRKKRKSIDFSKGVRGKYAGIKLVVVGATSNEKRSSLVREGTAEAVLKKVSRVLNSAGSSKRELESAINRARYLIESAGHA